MATWDLGSREIVITGVAIFAILLGLIGEVYCTHIKGITEFGSFVAVLLLMFLCQLGAFVFLDIMQQTLRRTRLNVLQGILLMIFLGIIPIFASAFLYDPKFGLGSLVAAFVFALVIRQNLRGLILSNIPNRPHRPMGPPSGRMNHPLTFSSWATHPRGEQVQLEFDWGDGTLPTVTAAVDSGRSAQAVHSWNTLGTFEIRVRALDGGRHSAYSEPWQVTINP